jgi:hypothetical protein
VDVGFVVDKVALEQVFLLVRQSSTVSVIPPMLDARSFIHHRRCTSLATGSVVKQHKKRGQKTGQDAPTNSAFVTAKLTGLPFLKVIRHCPLDLLEKVTEKANR